MGEKDIEIIKKEYDSLLQQLSSPELVSDPDLVEDARLRRYWERFKEISKRKNFLEKVIEKFEQLKELEARIVENKSIISSEDDRELANLAEGELDAFSRQKPNWKRSLKTY